MNRRLAGVITTITSAAGSFGFEVADTHGTAQDFTVHGFSFAAK